MNIEDERKAFEATVTKLKIMEAVGVTTEWNGERYVSKLGSKKPYQQAMFELWLAAKAHKGKDE